MSRGRMFFSSRLSMYDPTESHSACFSGYSAGKEDDPGRAIPRASVAEAIVFAVYIYVLQHGPAIYGVPLRMLQALDKRF